MNHALIEYNFGNGWMVVTGQPVEYNVVYNAASMGLVYPRLFNYVLGRANANANEPIIAVQGAAAVPRWSSGEVLLVEPLSGERVGAE